MIWHTWALDQRATTECNRANEAILPTWWDNMRGGLACGTAKFTLVHSHAWCDAYRNLMYWLWTKIFWQGSSTRGTTPTVVKCPSYQRINLAQKMFAPLLWIKNALSLCHGYKQGQIVQLSFPGLYAGADSCLTITPTEIMVFPNTWAIPEVCNLDNCQLRVAKHYCSNKQHHTHNSGFCGTIRREHIHHVAGA